MAESTDNVSFNQKLEQQFRRMRSENMAKNADKYTSIAKLYLIPII